MIRAALFWSGGKDAAACLHKIKTEQIYEVCFLITTLNKLHHRISMHGVRETLVDKQAYETGIPLKKIWVAEGTNQEYETAFGMMMTELKQEGITHVAFGDIFLQEIRDYREKILQQHNMTGVFPLWKIDSKLLLQIFLDNGFQAITCCIHSGVLNASFAGRLIDAAFIEELPWGVDVCGEHGEYHSFVFDGPIFKKKIAFFLGEKIYKPIEIKNTDAAKTETDGFWFVDLLPS